MADTKDSGPAPDKFDTVLGNYYGTVECEVVDGQPTVSLEDWSGVRCEPISRELYEMLWSEIRAREQEK